MLKAISVRQPWAWALLHGKDIENRTRPTRYRGLIAIHAASGMTRAEEVAARRFCAARGLALPPAADLVRGAVVGIAQLTDWVTAHESPWFTGDYGYCMADAQAFAVPFPACGQRGLWHWPIPDSLAADRAIAAAVVGIAQRGSAAQER